MPPKMAMPLGKKKKQLTRPPPFKINANAAPILNLLCFAMGMAASVFLADAVYDVPANVILDSACKAVAAWDVVTSVIKCWVFGTVIATVSCAWGYTTTGGAKGVGESTTSGEGFGVTVSSGLGKGVFWVGLYLGVRCTCVCVLHCTGQL